jgi:carboxylesterase
LDPQILEGAEAFSVDGGPVAALLLHGFTGSPQSLKDLGSFLSERGISVSAPRLPGHGTTWQDLSARTSSEWTAEAERAFERLASSHDEVFIVGLSFGVSVAVNLIAHHPGRIAGLTSLAGFIWTGDPRARFAPIIRRLVKVLPGVGNDIADPSGLEIAYEHLPTAATHEMLKFIRRARAELPEVDCPTLIIHSRNDHTAVPRNAEIIAQEVGASDVQMEWLDRSYHVVTLDYDRLDVFQRTFDFINERASHAL